MHHSDNDFEHVFAPPLVLNLLRANIGGQAPLLLDLPALDATWSDQQREILFQLRRLSKGTLTGSARRFAHYVKLRGQTPYPRSRGAARAAIYALQVGTRLNALNPNAEIARRCLECCTTGSYPIPPGATEEDRWRPPSGVAKGGVVVLESREFDRRQGRRTRLSKLPEDWPERVLAAAKTSSYDLRAGLLLMKLTGCRPCEVASAVLFLNPQKTMLFVELTCAKRTRGSQTELVKRRHHLNRWADDAEDLRQLVCAIKEGAKFQNVTAKTLENLLRRISQKIFPRIKPGVNASCFRNLRVAIWKSMGMPLEHIAYFAGHASIHTLSVYGMAAQARSKSYKPRQSQIESHSTEPTSESTSESTSIEEERSIRPRYRG